jgi:hypothetical protein
MEPPSCRPACVVVAALVVAPAATTPTDAAAAPWMVYVTNLGPEWSRIEVRTTHAGSPDSLTGELLHDGALQAGQVLTLRAPLACVSWRHTYGVLSNVSFSSWTSKCQRRGQPSYFTLEVRSDRP